MKIPPTSKKVAKPSKRDQRATLDAMLMKLATSGTVLLENLQGSVNDLKKVFKANRIIYFVRQHKILFCEGCKNLFKGLGWSDPPNSIFRKMQFA